MLFTVFPYRKQSNKVSFQALLFSPIFARMSKVEEKEKVNDNGVPLFKSELTKLDIELDKEVTYEFGGPLGTLAMMIGFPCLMYYFWVCLEYHQGKLITPNSYSFNGISHFITEDIIAKVKLGAAPTWLATKIYMGHVLFSFILAYTMPGPIVNGHPVASLKGKRVSVHVQL